MRMQLFSAHRSFWEMVLFKMPASSSRRSASKRPCRDSSRVNSRGRKACSWASSDEFLDSEEAGGRDEESPRLDQRGGWCALGHQDKHRKGEEIGDGDAHHAKGSNGKGGARRAQC